MRDSLHAAVALLVSVFAVQNAIAATILSSGDATQNFTSTNHPVTGPVGGASAIITADVGQSSAFGPWQQFLLNNATGPAEVPPHSISSGVNVGVNETITNLGGVTWNHWTEKVLSRTTISTFNDSPGFQFRTASILVEADYGSGFTVLTNGVHYTRVDTPATGIAFEPTAVEAFTLNFQPGFEIQNGDKLRINKNIFEVFNDGDIWLQGQAAQLGVFPGPVPEPSAAVACAFALTAFAARRHPRAV
jgi:hypothetical protein